MKLIDLTDQVFGRLTVIERAESVYTPKGVKCTRWLCRCSCDIDNPKYVIVRYGHLKNGDTKSCGCYRKEKLSKLKRQYNIYDLTGEYGIGYTLKDEPFYFDLEDYDKLKGYCWRYENNGYVETTVADRKLSMHRLVMNPSKSQEVDHIFHNKHDNRKSELRFVTRRQNSMNVKTNSMNTSGVKGVERDKRNNSWIAKIGINYKTISKSFSNKEDAIAHRKMWEEEYYGEYALKEQINNTV